VNPATGTYVVIPSRRVTDREERLAELVLYEGYTPIIVVEEGPPSAYALTVHRTSNTFGGWLNEGAQVAQAITAHPAVIACNNDLTFEPSALARMVDALDRHPIVGVEGPWTILTVPSPLRGHLFGWRPEIIQMPEPEGVALWWWNTDLMYHEAAERGLSVGFVPVDYAHVSDNERPDGSWRYPREFEWSVQADHDHFWQRYHHLNPEHMDCYLTWWPDALPEGQVHRTDWSNL